MPPIKSKRQNLTDRLANHIERSPKFFRDGTIISQRAFFQRFSKFYNLPPQLTLGTHLSYVQFQVSINKLLNLRGLRISSSDYYRKWHVEYDTNYPNLQIKAAKDLRNSAQVLLTGQRTYKGQLSLFTPDERLSVNTHIRANRVTR